METQELLMEIKKLPLKQRLELIELASNTISDNEIANERLLVAAEKLYGSYLNDKELTVFEALNHEDFYEPG